MPPTAALFESSAAPGSIVPRRKVRVLFINDTARNGGPGRSLFYILKFLDPNLVHRAVDEVRIEELEDVEEAAPGTAVACGVVDEEDAHLPARDDRSRSGAALEKRGGRRHLPPRTPCRERPQTRTSTRA